MSVAIRLQRRGRNKRPFYRIVAADKAMPRDGRYLELLGTYNTLEDPPAVTLDAERVKYWVGVGAQLSDTCSQIVKGQIPGYVEELESARLEKTHANRAKRKARQK